MKRPALARGFAEVCGFSPVSEIKPGEIKPVEEMWTPDALDRLVKRYPKGGTLWSKSRRTVRNLYTLHLKDDVVVALMTEHARGAKLRLYLFSKNGREMRVGKYVSPIPGVEVLLKSFIFSIIPSDFRGKLEEFIASEVRKIC